MRLLDTEPGHFVERDPRETTYAILSHTWDDGGEQSHKELKKIQKRYDLKVRCLRHATKNPKHPSPSPPECPPDASPLPMPTEGSSGAFAETPLENPSESHADEITTPRSLHSMEGDDSQDNTPAMTDARGSRLSQSSNALFEFVLLIFLRRLATSSS